MNLKEFAALKVGNKIENPAASGTGYGEITETTPSGVRVAWGPRHSRETQFFYSVVGTAWMNWIIADDQIPATQAESVTAAIPPGGTQNGG
jgi:hypothetical protein